MSGPGHLFLVGFMGAGKSTVGRLVAERLARPFLDLDALIEADAGLPVSRIFTEQGEESFRNRESAALHSMSDQAPSVVACGGGIVLRSENRALLKELGSVVYLEVSAGEALARIGDVSSRPLLAGGGGSLAATSLLAARESLYRSVADLVIDTEGHSPTEVAEMVSARYSGDGA